MCSTSNNTRNDGLRQHLLPRHKQSNQSRVRNKIVSLFTWLHKCLIGKQDVAVNHVQVIHEDLPINSQPYVPTRPIDIGRNCHRLQYPRLCTEDFDHVPELRVPPIIQIPEYTPQIGRHASVSLAPTEELMSTSMDTRCNDLMRDSIITQFINQSADAPFTLSGDIPPSNLVNENNCNTNENVRLRDDCIDIDTGRPSARAIHADHATPFAGIGDNALFTPTDTSTLESFASASEFLFRGYASDGERASVSKANERNGGKAGIAADQD